MRHRPGLSTRGLYGTGTCPIFRPRKWVLVGRATSDPDGGEVNGLSAIAVFTVRSIVQQGNSLVPKARFGNPVTQHTASQLGIFDQRRSLARILSTVSPCCASMSSRLPLKWTN